MEIPAGRLVIATDSHVVSPLFFPGGDIGCLAVHGTVNDVAMSGAKPLYLAATFVLEEGLPLADLKRIVASMAAASRAAGVPVVTGDTKVVEQGKGDGVFITTTGVGVVPDGVDIAGDRARPGDAIIVSGSLGDHGVAIMSLRENLTFETTIESDTAALHELVAAMVAAAPGIHCLRDPTRGGLATTLNEIARQSGCGMVIRERALPIKGRGQGGLRVPRPRPALCRQRRKARGDRAPRGRESRARRDARASVGSRCRGHRRGDRGPARLRPDGNRVRRPPQRRLADRRAVAAHLLTDAMRILLLTHAFNCLTQRLYVELTDSGHTVSIEFDVNDRVTEEAAALFRPEVIIAPFLKRAIPESVWRRYRCIVIHPGIPGDRGPSALDWAILRGETEWGVTALQANAEMDAGDIWASASFPMRDASKSSLYRLEVTDAALECVRMTLARMAERGVRAGAPRLRAPRHPRTIAAAGAPAGPRDRLALRRHGDRVAQDPRFRWLTRRARRGCRDSVQPLRRAS